jgi:hypothetical protein
MSLAARVDLRCLMNWPCDCLSTTRPWAPPGQSRNWKRAIGAGSSWSALRRRELTRTRATAQSAGRQPLINVSSDCCARPAFFAALLVSKRNEPRDGKEYFLPELRLIYAPCGETSGHLTFPVGALATVAGRPMQAGSLLLDSFRLFFDASDRRLLTLLRKSREAQAAVSTALAEQVLGALHELLRGLEAWPSVRIDPVAIPIIQCAPRSSCFTVMRAYPCVCCARAFSAAAPPEQNDPPTSPSNHRPVALLPVALPYESPAFLIRSKTASNSASLTWKA